MGCFDHNQEYIGACMWCGKQLCSRCVARASGKKLYCHNCVSNLGGVEIRHEQQDEPVKEQKFVQQPQAKPQPMQLKSQVKPLAGKVPTAAVSQAKASTPSATPVSSPAASSAAKSALGMFAQQAMEQLEAEKKKKGNKL